MKKKKSWDHKWYTDEFLREMQATARVRVENGLEIVEKYAPDAGHPLGVDRRLLGGPMGRTAKRMMLLPDFVLDRLRMRLDARGVADFRRGCDRIASAACGTGGVELQDAHVTASDGFPIPIRIYRSSRCAPGCPCLYFMHGGGFIGGSIPPYDEAWKVFVEKFHMVVVSVAYRLPPEHPYPTLYEDCWQVLTWIAQNGGRLGIDPSRIFVAGDSAGGNLAQYCAHRGGRGLVRGQLLLYAALNPFGVTDADYRQGCPELACAPGQRRLSRCILRQTEMMAGSFAQMAAMLGVDGPDDRCSPYTRDPAGQPPAFLSAGVLDYFKKDTVAWAHKLQKAGVPVRVVLYNGMGHGYLNAMGVFPQAEDVVEEMGRFIRQYS